ncbi:MAG TPA: LssY C-terminal domain-containing protein [Ktedonobacterales bacterium]|nr:LssY C-terminal domain-containing protein [Ktedonobacterales bacterium]
MRQPASGSLATPEWWTRPWGDGLSMGAQISDLFSLFIQLAPLTQALIIAALVVVVALLSVLIIAGIGALRLWLASRAGRRASKAEVFPATNFSRDGKPSDPLNLRIIGTADQLSAAFISAGWYRADEITLVTSLRIIADALLARKYSSAPVSDLYLFGRKQDFAFEKPGKNVRQRDHVRFWKANQPARDSRPLWVGGATRDAKVELSKTNHLPTHGIAPDVDDERALIVDDLIRTGWVVAERAVPAFPGPTRTQNAMGDHYQTDGMAIQLTLARTQPVPLLPQLIRQPGSKLVQNVTRGLRRNLPQQGRELARQWQERRAQRGNKAPTEPRQPSDGA